MKYVLDASAALCWVLPHSGTAQGVRLRDQWRQGLLELIAPIHFPVEIASALTKAERQKLIPVGGARKLIQDVLVTVPVLHVIDSLFYRAVDLSSQTRSNFLDCLYVALAEQESCEMVTADNRLIQNLQRQFPFIKSLSSLP